MSQLFNQCNINFLITESQILFVKLNVLVIGSKNSRYSGVIPGDFRMPLATEIGNI